MLPKKDFNEVDHAKFEKWQLAVKEVKLNKLKKIDERILNIFDENKRRDSVIRSSGVAACTATAAGCSPGTFKWLAYDLFILAVNPDLVNGFCKDYQETKKEIEIETGIDIEPEIIRNPKVEKRLMIAAINFGRVVAEQFGISALFQGIQAIVIKCFDSYLKQLEITKCVQAGISKAGECVQAGISKAGECVQHCIPKAGEFMGNNVIDKCKSIVDQTKFWTSGTAMFYAFVCSFGIRVITYGYFHLRMKLDSNGGYKERRDEILTSSSLIKDVISILISSAVYCVFPAGLGTMMVVAFGIPLAMKFIEGLYDIVSVNGWMGFGRRILQYFGFCKPRVLAWVGPDGLEAEAILENLFKSSQDEVLRDVVCPITRALMVEPVIVSCGCIFEEEFIIKWLVTHSKCPMCEKTISSSPNYRKSASTLKNIIYEIAAHYQLKLQ